MNGIDKTEAARREMVAEINDSPTTREDLKAVYGKVWDTRELQEEFEVMAFMAPFCVVKHRTEGLDGVVQFQHSPRYYFSFREAGA
jgi:hypothetical protein